MAALILFAALALAYWLVVITEGVYLGRRAVVWMYDRTAEKYDGIKQYDDESEQFFVVRPLLLRLNDLPAPRILDVATGTGRLPWFLLETPVFIGRVVGVDASERMLQLAVDKLSPWHGRASFALQTADALGFADASFDAVACLEALEFFPDDLAALREMVRVLRSGGTLMVTRRRGWEAKTFLGRYRDRTAFESLLESLGLDSAETQLWQVDYDLVFATKPHA